MALSITLGIGSPSALNTCPLITPARHSLKIKSDIFCPGFNANIAPGSVGFFCPNSCSTYPSRLTFRRYRPEGTFRKSKWPSAVVRVAIVCSRSSPLTSWTVAFFNGALSKTRITIPETTHVSSPAFAFALEAGFGEVWAKTTAAENRLSGKARSVLCTAATYERSAILLYHTAVLCRGVASQLGDNIPYGSVSDSQGAHERRSKNEPDT